ncbi:hypothetical protein SAMN04515695_2832 [Pseudovibrio sp. Tun.PSC04-5.I4]|nr:hypothetical protein SAMN04515695_2832 [Pseudovibrio sp. Tun.PSC04-5.I4]
MGCGLSEGEIISPVVRQPAVKRRKKVKQKATFASESDMCAHFIKLLPEEWIVYPEWANWDILLIRKSDGLQIGVEAKLRLSAKVISQAGESAHEVDQPGPDCRAVLIPKGSNLDFQPVCKLLCLQIIEIESPESKRLSTKHWYHPNLPKPGRASSAGYFKEFYPQSRHLLPEIVPAVPAGKSSPIKLTPWKIKAIKLDVLLKRHGVVTRKIFKALGLSTTLFLYSDKKWMQRCQPKGAWERGPNFPDLQKGCEENYEELEKRYTTWSKTLPLEEPC